MSKAKFLKQYLLDLPDRTRLYFYIFRKDDDRIVFGQWFQMSDGVRQFLDSEKEIDLGEILSLDKQLLSYLVSINAKFGGILQTLEFPSFLSYSQQVEVLSVMGFGKDYLPEDDSNKKEEIEKLEKMWNLGQGKKKDEEDCSSIEWLFDCIQKWAESSRNKGKAVEFIGSFSSIDLQKEEIDNRIIAYGFKNNLLSGISKIDQDLKKETNDFVNW